MKTQDKFEWEIIGFEPGHIFEDWIEDGIRHLVMRGPAALCAYLGIPKDHPLAGFGYNDVVVNCHCGLTFASMGDGERFPEDRYWFGWDYAHSGDCCTYNHDPKMGYMSCRGEKHWTVKEVKAEMWSAACDLKKQMNLAEKVAQKAMGWTGSKLTPRKK